MSSHRFSIDCHEEEARFRSLLSCGSSERVMAIRADGESGKSHFVQRITRVCLNHEPLVPASVVDFAEFREGEPLELVRAVRGAFGSSIDFSRFDGLLRDLDMRIWNPAVGVADVRGASFEGARDVGISGTTIQNPKGPVNVTSAGAIELADENALQAARTECLREFFGTLASHCAKSPAVIMLDTYDQCAAPVAKWLEHEARDRFVNGAWPEQLVLVVAGRKIPAFEEQWPQRQYEERVVLLDGFSPWKPEDIEEGFREIGWAQPPDLFDHIVEFLNRGATPGQLVGLMQLAGPPTTHGGS